jgi:benzoate transport
MTIHESVEISRMSRFQAAVVGICLVINVVEGFDVLVMAFAASGIADEWSLSQSSLGLLLSSGLVGMAAGSALVAPLADRFGRRPITTVALVLCAAGMAVAALSTGPVILGLGRVLTGVGVGATVASLPVIITELTPKPLRGTMIALYAAGLPAGGILGGAMAQLLVSEHGWRAPFVVGGLLTAALVVIVIVSMPESLQYLQHRQPKNALTNMNRTLQRMGLPLLSTMPDPSATQPRLPAHSVLNRSNAPRTLLLWLCYFVLMGGFYFAASWTPRLLEQSGLSTQQGINAGLLLNLGGLLGTVLLGILALKTARSTLTATGFLACGVSFLAMTQALGSPSAALTVAIAIGVFVNASAAGLHSIGPELYSAAVRATGMGWAMGVGRVGALTAPVVAGVLLDKAWSPESLFGAIAWPMVAAAIAVLVMTRPAQPRRASVQPARNHWNNERNAGESRSAAPLSSQPRRGRRPGSHSV